MFWMDVVAGEAVAVLSSLGYMWKIDTAVLGLTVSDTREAPQARGLILCCAAGAGVGEQRG